MTDVVIPYTPRPLQKELHVNLVRWNLFVCHRRFGKTVAMINQLIKDALKCRRDNPRYGYLAPTYRQAKNIAWDYLKHYSRPIPGIRVNEQELRVDYPHGGRVQLFGCDNPDALRGAYWDGVVLDEYAQMPPSLFSEVIRPALSDREGYAVFIGTPKGRNAFYELYERVKHDPDWLVRVYRASQTGIVRPEELEDARKIMDEDEYLQEYECSWSAAIKGAYYSTQMHDAESRICAVNYDAQLPVHTAWDLGVGDSTAIWFFQEAGPELRLIDYYESSGVGLEHYIRHMQTLPYVYGEHWAPHDIEVRELGTGKSRLEVARGLGVSFRIAPKLSVDDGIQAARSLITRCWFDETRCYNGIEALKNYRKEWDERRQEFRPHPFHDWSSHAADAFRYLAVSRSVPKKRMEPINYPKLGIV